MPQMTSEIITFVVGGGLAALITAVVRGYRSVRAGARASTREVVKDLVADRDAAEARTARTQRDRDYWRSVAGDYGYQLRSAGLVPDPERPRSPTEREADRPRTARRRRAAPEVTTGELRRIVEDDEQ